MFLFISRAHAYFDPGTGTFIIQSIIAFFVAGFFTFQSFWSKLKILFMKFFIKLKKK